MRYTIFLNHNPSEPIGFLELEDHVPESAILAGAIIPLLIKKSGETKWTIRDFGLVPRITVNTGMVQPT